MALQSQLVYLWRPSHSPEVKAWPLPESTPLPTVMPNHGARSMDASSPHVQISIPKNISTEK
ncbi:hypothetical protein BO78DRAFT_396826 [Aspergillus sclerotiicarbonarius CBS 121057]|uniref:Uncharacterized protein n=1 Tax=Aspergillus sclerotiicarbonarius (strain CBS 121057 / IBT 28362) TaxID=1448318 RepID=A0A319EJQ4_ASPSB|nr:hypothetical protein BO78DRAFT_396826 [Aspergillus sclerotiicarbonarius CBS 121057]